MDGNSSAKISAIVLAAGSSRRFGADNKLLAQLAGRPLIAWSVAAFAASRVSEIVVVTGPDREAIEAALAGERVRFVHNPDHLSGMGGSVATGASAIGNTSDGVMIAPGDMPGLTSEHINQLIAAFETSGKTKIVRPQLPDGAPGHPVLWPAKLLPRLSALGGPEGGKQLLADLAADVVAIAVADQGAALDVDTTSDLEATRRLMRDTHGS